MNDESRFVNASGSENDRSQEKRLRPQDFSEFVGQKRVIENIEVMVQSAIKRNAAMDHVLFSGPPGLGKTSLAMIISTMMGRQLHVISGPAIEKKGDIAAILTNLGERDVLFIDEIHRLHISVEEILYSAMEDFRLDIVLGQGPAARTMQIDIPHFTLIGATTRAGLLSNPLRDRFMAPLSFDFYESDELAQIISNNAPKMELKVDQDAIDEMASRSRGTPRIANRILRRVRDFALVADRNVVSLDDVHRAMNMLGIDSLGLDPMDQKILKVIKDYYSGGPVGIEALCATLAEDRHTIEGVYEPFLLKTGLILRTPRGRVLSDKALNHID